MYNIEPICLHTKTQGRAGEAGVWCISCGEKVWDVEQAPCGLCRHFKPDGYQIGLCEKRGFAVLASRLITYAVAEGRCFEAHA